MKQFFLNIFQKKLFFLSFLISLIFFVVFCTRLVDTVTICARRGKVASYAIRKVLKRDSQAEPMQAITVQDPLAML